MRTYRVTLITGGAFYTGFNTETINAESPEEAASTFISMFTAKMNEVNDILKEAEVDFDIGCSIGIADLEIKELNTYQVSFDTGYALWLSIDCGDIDAFSKDEAIDIFKSKFESEVEWINDTIAESGIGIGHDFQAGEIIVKKIG